MTQAVNSGGGRSFGAIGRACTLAAVLLSSPVWAERSGGIAGRVVDAQREGIAGVTVTLQELGRDESTDTDGRYLFAAVPPGRYTLALRLGENSATVAVTVEAGSSLPVETQVDWLVSFAETITVTAASRQTEAVVAAPAAVTLVTGTEAERQPSHGQLPRLLEFSPAVDFVQSGLYDFNLNTRGFNGAVTPRVLTLIDGRDPSLPGIGSQDWAAVSFPVDDVAHLELVRGPGSALYGEDAYNGVLDVTTKEPRASRGGIVRLTGGELDTRRLELRYAGAFGRETYFKVLGGYQESSDFARPRVESVEYEPARLPTEALSPPLDRVRLAFGGLRLDRYFGSRTLSAEIGTSEHEGTITVSDAGRAQQTDVARPWGRVRFTAPHWSLQASHTGQVSNGIRSLSSGGSLYLDSSRTELDLQASTPFSAGRGRLLGGMSASRESLDSADPEGRQTIFSQPQDADRQSAYGQVEYDLPGALKAVVAARWDESDLYDGQLSPRGALVYALSPRHTFRLSYSRGFQSPSFSQVFLRAPVAPPLDLSALEDALKPLLGGVSLGFGRIPLLALGNEDLKPERITGLELGYNAILGTDLFLSLGCYRNRLDDFATDLLPQIGTSLGRLNPRFGPYAPPSTLSPEAAAAVLAALRAALPANLFASLSNDLDGSPIIVFLSQTNSGRVDTRGFELALTYAWSRDWMLDFNYSYFDFAIRQAALEAPLVPNTPRNKLALTLSRAGEDWSSSIRYRWVEGFDWASGIFVGPVPSYSVVDLALNYRFQEHWQVGIDVANLLNKEHYEIFGGDLLRRRALAYLSWSW